MFKLFLTFAVLCQFAFADTKSDALKLFEKRDEQASLEQALTLFEKAHQENPQDLEIITYLVRGNFILAENHLSKEDQKLKTFEKARSIGEKGLETNADYKALVGKDVEKAISKLTKKEAPTLFWTAASLGKWSKINGIMSSIKFKDQILAMIRKVEELEPNYFHGAVPRYWGSFYALAPGIAGGDMKKSKKNFMKAIEMAPEYLASKRLYAELYLVKEDEKKEFKRVLEEVISAKDGPSEIAPENRMEKKYAQQLLKDIDDLF